MNMVTVGPYHNLKIILFLRRSRCVPHSEPHNALYYAQYIQRPDGTVAMISEHQQTSDCYLDSHVGDGA